MKKNLGAMNPSFFLKYSWIDWLWVKWCGCFKIKIFLE